MKHVLLIGATDGIGLALAKEFLYRRWRVGIVGRNPEKLDRVLDSLTSIPGAEVSGTICDVRQLDHVQTAFDEALRKLGQLDLMVYCAGVDSSSFELSEPGAAAREIFAVNCTGAVAFSELASNYLQDAGKGCVAVIGSMAGERGRKGSPVYCASKAAVHTYMEGLRHRVHGTGVTVSTIKPGFVRTRMLAGRDPIGAVEPETAARRIIDGLLHGRELLFVPGWWRVVSWLLRVTPRWLFKRIGPA